MSNMRKSFEAKSKLRRMADGGIFKSTQRIGQDDIQVFTDAKYAAPDAQPYVPRAFRELPNQGITTGGVTTPLPAGAAPVPVITPAPPMPDPAKLSVGPPRAGMTAPPMPTAPAPVRTLSAYDKSVGNSALTQRQDPYDKMTGKPPVAVAARPRAPNIGMDYMAQSGGFGPTSAAPPPAPALRQMGAMGQPLMTSVGFAAGGHVKGPGGPTDDKVGPVMLSDGEYVLPADTVRAVGKHNLDAVKDATHTPVKRRGLRGMADGTLTEEEKRRSANNIVQTVAAFNTPSTPPVISPTPRQTVAAFNTPSTPPGPGMSHEATGIPQGKVYSPGPHLVGGYTGGAQTVEKQAPALVRGADGKFPGFDVAGGHETALAAPVGTVSLAEPATPLRSLKLESMGVSQGDQMGPVYEMKQSALPDAPQVGAAVTPSAFASPGAKQLNSKYYQDANGAVLEGTAPVGAPASVAAGPKTLGDPNGAPTAWSDVPRTYRSDTIRAGTDPGAYTNFGEGIFGTSSKEGGPIDTFTGVGANYNSESARLGPDPNGADRARQDAMVDAMFPDKPTPRSVSMPEFRSGARDINARFDKQLKAAEQRFTSPRAAGNLAKAQLQIEEARAAALNQDADNITRQQQSAMQFQSDQSRNALTERDLTQRAAQAARADETDRLGIDAQHQRAADAAAATQGYRATKLELDQYKAETHGMKFPPSIEEWTSGKRDGGGGGYTNAKDAERFSKRVTDQATKNYGPGTPKQQAIVANPQLLYGSPDQAVITHAEPLKYLVDYFGVANVGVPVRNEKGSYEWDAPVGERFDSASGTWDSSRALLGGKVYKFVGPDKKERYLRVGQGGDDVQRLVEGYFAMKDPPKDK